MTVYDIWPYFLCQAFLLAFISLPLFKETSKVASTSKGRVVVLDGLRGFAAYAVFFHHASIYVLYLQTGQWQYPPALFYKLLGQVGVEFFFMITGYLFWARLIAEKGKLNWLSLYIGRLFRIGPVYLFVVLILVFLVFLRAKWQLYVPFEQLITQILSWLPLGVIRGFPINNEIETTNLTAGVAWSLQYEWGFYASLLVLAFAARANKSHLPFALILFVVLFAWLIRGGGEGTDSIPLCGMLFAMGMICASAHKNNLCLSIPDPVASILAIALLAIVFLICSTGFAWLPVVILGIVFYLLISGATLFGLLTMEASRRLGDISYSVYLLQGLVLAGFYCVSGYKNFALLGPMTYWISTLIVAVTLTIFGVLCFSFIEKPGIHLGKKCAQLLGKRRKTN